MKKALLKKSFLLSFVGHLAAFGIFSFTFGERMLPGNESIYYRGNILGDFDLKPFKSGYDMRNLLPIFKKFPVKVNYTAKSDLNLYYKPASYVALIKEKADFIYTEPSKLPEKERPSIILHPRLPRYFYSYFKDREIVHIELSFNIKPFASGDLIEIKRKISSGNLQADLICMRNINRYLFMQRKMFTPNTWQSVKIDLSVKDDQY